MIETKSLEENVEEKTTEIKSRKFQYRIRGNEEDHLDSGYISKSDGGELTATEAIDVLSSRNPLPNSTITLFSGNASPGKKVALLNSEEYSPKKVDKTLNYVIIRKDFY